MGSRIAIIGTGYVGLTTGACFAHIGHDVVCADIDPGRIERLSRGILPIYEPGLQEIVDAQIASGRLRFVVGAAEAARDCEFAYLCVQTPQGEDGAADLTYLQQAAAEIASALPPEAVVVNKSTVPVGSTKVVERVLGRHDVSVVSNPEFLREGSAVSDFLKPDRVVIGSDDPSAATRVADLYTATSGHVIVTDPASAETIKYAANAFLATKISFVNAVAAVCEAVGADVNDVVLGIGYDKRIGHEFLKPGPGWGGSCFAGNETVLIRVQGEVTLVRFEDLGALWKRHRGRGIEVLSWEPSGVRPEFERVTAITARPYKGEMVTLRTKMGRRLTVTADHPMIARFHGAEPQVVMAGDLTDAHWLPLAIGDPLHESLADDSVSMIEAIEPADLEWSNVIVRLTETQAAAARTADGILSASRRYDSRRSNTLRLNEAAVLPLQLQGAMLGTTTNGTYVPALLPLNERVWEVIGLYLAEGHIGSDKQRRRTCWSFHPDKEQHLAEFVAETWRSMGIKTTVRRLTTTMQVSISSRLFASMFQHVLGLGHNCYNHRIPDLAWTATEDERRALLRGLWTGDGSWSYVAGGPSVILEYGTVSRELADGMVRLLASLGVVARLKVGRTAKSTVDTYWLCVSGAEQISSALWLLRADQHDEILESIGRQAKRIAPTGYRADGKGTSWVRVVDVERRHNEQTVYSLEVDRTHTVVTSFGLVAHNCFPKDTRAMVKIAEDAGYDFNLLKGVVVVNDEQRDRMVAKVQRAVGGNLQGAVVAAWGLTFKANTDDLRESPAIAIIGELQQKGAVVRAYDPQVKAHASIDVGSDPYAVCEGADALIVLTEWDEFRWLDLDEVKARLAKANIVDTRNLLDRSAAIRLGFTYQGVGR